MTQEQFLSLPIGTILDTYLGRSGSGRIFILEGFKYNDRDLVPHQVSLKEWDKSAQLWGNPHYYRFFGEIPLHGWPHSMSKEQT